MFPEHIEAMLRADLPASAVSQRSQGKQTLSYIEAWFAIAEANRIFGFGNWLRETIEIKCIHEHGEEAEGRNGAYFKHYVSYLAKVRITVLSGDAMIVREGCGTGHGNGMADIGLAHESALKEAESDAMKRALMTFGNRFGLALYDKSQSNVVDEARQQQFVSYCKGYASEVLHAAMAEFNVSTPDEVPQRDWKAFTSALDRLKAISDDRPTS